MEHNDLLKLDLGQIARARARARRKNPSAGLDYLHDRAWRELGERWTAVAAQHEWNEWNITTY